MLFFKAVLGALLIVIISLVARTKSYYLAGLVLLFPTFSLLAHYLMGREQGLAKLRETVLFGVWSVLPYLLYLGVLYFLLGRWKLVPSLFVATALWFVAALILVLLWPKV
ncbi:MAG: hypothetical protein A2X49_13155 [Lentisphaerae bacterium GWF2_52_8]|nr:MAG: hypothetical protein A2X49_13155 [Lentisphaerae bacterium GWF2_52_8]